MQIESRFDFGDILWKVERRGKGAHVTCSGCNGDGTILLADESKAMCPRCCYRKVEWKVERPEYVVVGPLTVGQIQMRLYPPDCTEYESERWYMCHETGVRSGTRHREGDCFKSQEVAQRHANLLNSGRPPRDKAS